MLPAAHRIRTAADFRQATRRGAKAARGRVVVYLESTDDQRPALIGIIASSSIGGSVVRHRASRRIRGAVASVLSSLPHGSRVVVRALPGADSDPLLPQQVQAGIAYLLRDRSR